VKTVSNRVVRHSLAYLNVQKWLVGNVILKVNCLLKVNHPLVWERMPAVQKSSKEIPCISYFHFNDYNVVCNF